jgi:hypothetical protein
VQVGAGPVEQANDGGVDVPHLVGSRRSVVLVRLGPACRLRGAHRTPAGPTSSSSPASGGADNNGRIGCGLDFTCRFRIGLCRRVDYSSADARRSWASCGEHNGFAS